MSARLSIEVCYALANEQALITVDLPEGATLQQAIEASGILQRYPQIDLGMQFLLDHQISDDSAYLMANPDAARGGFLMSAVKRYVRIDFIQHGCSSMLRASQL